MFPAPREVDKHLYGLFGLVNYEDTPLGFPAPREVDRELYTMFNKVILIGRTSFRPLAR